MPSDRIFRYVRHADVDAYKATGWHPVPALDSTYHGQWSVLMEYRGPEREHPMSPPNNGDCIITNWATRATPLQVGTKVVDRDGHKGTIVAVCEWSGDRWYEVRFPAGVAVRYDADLTRKGNYE